MANGFTGTRAITGGSRGGPSEEETNKLLQALVMILQQRTAEPDFVDSQALLARSFPQPPASSFRPSSGQFGQNNAIFSNVSQVPSRGQRRLADTGATLLNVIKAIQARKKGQGGGKSQVPSGTFP